MSRSTPTPQSTIVRSSALVLAMGSAFGCTNVSTTAPLSVTQAMNQPQTQAGPGAPPSHPHHHIHTDCYVPPRFVRTPIVEIDSKQITLGEKIGEGGYGQVLHGTWTPDDQQAPKLVAVKKLLLDAASASKLASFKREIGLANSLRHPSLVHVHGVCSKLEGRSGDHAVVMEYLPFNMSRLIAGDMPDGRQDDLSLTDRLLILMDVARALCYLHNLPGHTNSLDTVITHADIKPANILLTRARPYRGKLADFGISHLEHRAGITYTQTLRTSAGVQGTPMYMAPELHDDEPYRGPATDIWSFGCVILELFTRQKPWAGLNPHQVIGRLMNKRMPNVPDAVPVCVRPLVHLCLTTAPASRPTADYVFGALAGIREAVLRAQTKLCCICQEQRPAHRGWECSGPEKHFTCCQVQHNTDGTTNNTLQYQPHRDPDAKHDDGENHTHGAVDDKEEEDVPCIVGLVNMALDPVKLRRDRGAIPCPVPNCPSQPYGNRHVALLTRWGQEAVSINYMNKMQQFIDTLLQSQQEQAQQVAQAHVQAQDQVTQTATATDIAGPDAAEARLVADITLHRQHITEEILNLRCPACRAVFIDYDGCDALTCDNCGVAFCALCLANCGEDAHRHVAQEHGGNVFGGIDNFRHVHAERRTRELITYLERVCRAMPVEHVRRLIQLIWMDGNDQGINMERIHQRLQLQAQQQREQEQGEQEQQRQVQQREQAKQQEEQRQREEQETQSREQREKQAQLNKYRQECLKRISDAQGYLNRMSERESSRPTQISRDFARVLRKHLSERLYVVNSVTPYYCPLRACSICPWILEGSDHECETPDCFCNFKHSLAHFTRQQEDIQRKEKEACRRWHLANGRRSWI